MKHLDLLKVNVKSCSVRLSAPDRRGDGLSAASPALSLRSNHLPSTPGSLLEDLEEQGGEGEGGAREGEEDDPIDDAVRRPKRAHV